MIEHLMNYAASFANVPGWGGLEVNGFANLLLVLVVLVIVSEIGIAIHDRTRKTKQKEKVLLPQETQERIANPPCEMGTY